RGGRVERLGRGGAPVDEPRLVLVVAQADPPDVQGARALGGRFRVDAAEGQAVVDRVQLGQPPGLLDRGEIALAPGLGGAAGAAAAERPGQRPLGPVPRLVEQPVKHIHIRLLLARSRGSGGIALTKRHIYWYTFLGLRPAGQQYCARYESLSSRFGSW